MNFFYLEEHQGTGFWKSPNEESKGQTQTQTACTGSHSLET